MKTKHVIPFIFLFILLGFLGHELFYAKPHEIPSALIGSDMPSFQLTNIMQPEKKFTNDDLQGHISLVNVWATWCPACAAEEALLLEIKAKYRVRIYGIDYKDKPEDIKQWLSQHQNPYDMIGADINGDVAIDLGIYGTPETFVVNKDGKIVYRHVGMLDQAAWDETIHPLINQLESENT